MSLVLVSEPQENLPIEAGELSQGTWFIDQYDQIYVIASDDESGEKRIICVGDFCEPFIPNVTAQHLNVKRILPTGSMLEIAPSVPLLEGRSS